MSAAGAFGEIASPTVEDIDPFTSNLRELVCRGSGRVSQVPRAIFRNSVDKKQPRQGGTAAVESERIAWGEMDAPWHDNVAKPKRLHVDRTKFARLRFRGTATPARGAERLRRGDIAQLPPLGAKTE
jgi:hypothetical protein